VKKSIVLLIALIIVSVCPVSAGDSRTGRISGKIMMKDGGPLTGGIVNFYNEKSGSPPAPDRYWRVPDLIADIDEDGGFNADLEEGSYYIGALQQISGGNVGPPEEGDYFFISKERDGRPRIYSVKEGVSREIGVLAEAVPFHAFPADVISGIEGTILNAEGKPAKGTIVFAFATPEMVGQALFVSNRTGKDGKYVLRVHRGGTYYLAVRDVHGGGPPEGGMVISGHSTIPAKVKEGEVTKGLDIKVRRDPE